MTFRISGICLQISFFRVFVLFLSSTKMDVSCDIICNEQFLRKLYFVYSQLLQMFQVNTPETNAESEQMGKQSFAYCSVCSRK